MPACGEWKARTVSSTMMRGSRASSCSFANGNAFPNMKMTLRKRPDCPPPKAQAARQLNPLAFPAGSDGHFSGYPKHQRVASRAHGTEGENNPAQWRGLDGNKNSGQR